MKWTGPVALLAALVALMCAGLFGADLASAHHGHGESHPRNYGREHCATLAHDLSVNAIPNDGQPGTFDLLLHSAGCDQDNDTGRWVPRNAAGCNSYAYSIARAHFLPDKHLSRAEVKQTVRQVRALACRYYTDDGTYGAFPEKGYGR